MPSLYEQQLARSLRAVLAGLPLAAEIPHSDAFQDVLTRLQFFIPATVAEIHPEVPGIDDVIAVVARKTADGEAEILGLCGLVADQTLIPVHLQLQVATSADEISWLECRLGEREQATAERLVRKPYRYLTAMKRKLIFLNGQLDQIDWVYQVTYGERRGY